MAIADCLSISNFRFLVCTVEGSPVQFQNFILTQSLLKGKVADGKGANLIINNLIINNLIINNLISKNA